MITTNDRSIAITYRIRNGMNDKIGVLIMVNWALKNKTPITIGEDDYSNRYITAHCINEQQAKKATEVLKIMKLLLGE